MDAYHAPYVLKHRYWIGILLFTRIIHHFLSSILDESMHPLVVSCLMCCLLVIKILAGKLYKNWVICFLETSFIFNLLLFSVTTYYIDNTNGDQVVLASISVLIAFITFACTALYHTYKYLIKDLKAYRKLTNSLLRYLQMCRPKFMLTNRNSTTNDLHAPTQNTCLLREPALDDITPHRDQDSPPIILPLIHHPVTSTVVDISNALGDDYEDQISEDL